MFCTKYLPFHQGMKFATQISSLPNLSSNYFGLPPPGFELRLPYPEANHLPLDHLTSIKTVYYRLLPFLFSPMPPWGISYFYMSILCGGEKQFVWKSLTLFYGVQGRFITHRLIMKSDARN